MSYAVHAYVVVGVRIKEQELWENVKVKACSHEVGDNAKFCPECGCPTNKTEKREIAGYDGYDQYNDLSVIHVGQYEDQDTSEVIVGQAVAQTYAPLYRQDQIVLVDHEKFSDIMSTVKNKLQDAPFKGEFGVWLGVYESY